ncbi:MAG: PEP-CTERM sorting domain-containing protein [Planctomycetes bacterium]|nr:PEP-CTERM sorting domain-containing protein [Planctomycetota bacterium]
MKAWRSSCVTAVVLASIAVVASVAPAANVNFLQEYSGGTYDDAFTNNAYWSTGTAPLSTDRARFMYLSDGTVTAVRLQDDFTHTAFVVAGYGSTQKLIVDLNGHTHTATETRNGYFTVGGSEGVGTLELRDTGAVKGQANWTKFDVGFASLNTGELLVNGATINCSGTSSEIRIASQGTGKLTITNGGVLSAAVRNMYVAIDNVINTRGESTTGTVVVDGSASSMTVADLWISGKTDRAGGNASLTIQNGASVTATGTLTVWDPGSVTVTGGSLQAAAMNLKDNSDLALTVNDSISAAIVNITGDLTIGSGVVLSLQFDDAGAYGDFIPLIQYAGALSGTFAGLEEGSQVMVGGTAMTLTYTGGDNNTTIALVPEPMTMSLLALGAAGLVVRRRK